MDDKAIALLHPGTVGVPSAAGWFGRRSDGAARALDGKVKGS